MNNDPRYVAVDEALPDVMPPITRTAVLPYFHKLIAKFATDPDDYSPGYEERANGYAVQRCRSRYGKARACWASRKSTQGHYKGWGRMIHDASHIVFELRHPKARAHDPGHAKLEREMAAYVMRQGWIARETRMLPPVPRDKLGELQAEKAREQHKLVRWERKLKRAQNAIKKVKARVRVLDKRIEKLGVSQ